MERLGGVSFFVGFIIGAMLSAGMGLMPIALGCLVCGAFSTYLGLRLNVYTPAEQIAQREAQFRAGLDAELEAGRFRFGPDVPPPASPEEARQQAEHDKQQTTLRLRNRRTGYGIPMQYIGMCQMVLGLVFFRVWGRRVFRPSGSGGDRPISAWTLG